MEIIRTSSRVWGKMASGILFRHNGRVLLDLRSKNVDNGGTWSIPGGSSSDGFHDSESLKKFDITKEIKDNLWKNALREVGEEIGYFPSLSQAQLDSVISIPNWNGGHLYMTFMVDLNDEQAEEVEGIRDFSMYDGEEEGESSEHQWVEEKNVDTMNLHPEFKKFWDRMKSQVDVETAEIGKTASLKFATKTQDSWTQGQVYIDEAKGKVYDVEKMQDVTKNNKVREMKSSLFYRQLNAENVWGTKDNPLSPMMVMHNPTFDHINIEHMSRIRTSDLDFPILVRASNGLVLDGCHRLSKAFMLKKEYIKVIMVQEEQMRESEIESISN